MMTLSSWCCFCPGFSHSVLAGNGRLLDIVTVALGQASKGTWYVNTQELQLASFDVCVACRDVCTLGVFVDKSMPRSLWGENDSSADPLKIRGRRRLLALKAAGVYWKFPAGMLVPVLSGSGLLKNVEWLQMTGVICGDKESCATHVSRAVHSSRPGTSLAHSPRQYFRVMVTFLDLQNLDLILRRAYVV